MKKRIDIIQEDLDIEDEHKSDLYSDMGMDLTLDNDEITAAEEGFMRGYSRAYNEYDHKAIKFLTF